MDHEVDWTIRYIALLSLLLDSTKNILKGDSEVPVTANASQHLRFNSLVC